MSSRVDDITFARLLGDEYKLLGVLGEGGYGTVFKAVQRSTGQLVAIKAQQLDGREDAASRALRLARFEREMRLCAQLSHPNIVRLLARGARDDFLFLVFEFVPGETLARYLARRRHLPPAEAVALMAQVLEALVCAHAAGIVHRDLKPDNIMVVAGGVQLHAKVLDFGIGASVTECAAGEPALTRSREVLGTPCYTAPEQLRGEAATTGSDLYAWGLVFLECLTGRRVVEGATMAEIVHRQLNPSEIPLPAGLSGHPLGELLRRALTKSARSRASDAARVWADLQRLRVADLSGFIAPHPASTPEPTVALHATERAGERRHATAVCFSITGGDAAADLELIDALQAELRALCVDIATRFGGQCCGSLAARTIVVFGVPQANDGDARRAVRAVLQMQARMGAQLERLAAESGVSLEFRAAVHTDFVLVDLDGAPSGPALNGAAELEGRAEPSTIVASAETLRLVQRYVVSQPLPEQRAMRPGAHRIVAERPEAQRLAPAELVGRAAELEHLARSWEQACAGRGGAVLLRGEPGIGKSCIARAMEERARQSGAAVLHCQCLIEDENSTLYPVLTLLRRHFDLDGGERLASIERLRAELDARGLDGGGLVPILCSWLAIDTPSQAPSLLSGERQRECLLEALSTWLAAAGGLRGSLVVIEDLHWADATTRELVSRIAAAAARRNVLLLLTARPEVELGLDDIETIELRHLDRPAVERLIHLHATGTVMDASLLDEIVARTDGVPLYIEELTRSLLDAPRPSPTQAPLPIPASLRDLLASRLDRLGTAKETAQLASAIGREFDLELLGAVASRDAGALRADIDVLLQASVLAHDGDGVRYAFRHELIRQAAWDSMLSPQRRGVHRDIAALLEAAARVDGASASRLAWHFEHAGEREKAARYRLAASQQAALRSSYREAIDHVQSGLALLSGVTEAGRRVLLELELRSALGGMLVATEGFASPGVIATYSRCRDLVGQAPATPLQRFTTLKGMWTFHNATANLAEARRICDELLALAAQEGDSQLQLSAHQCATETAVLTGQFERALSHSAECDRWFEPKRQREQVSTYGVDPWLSAVSFECIALTLLGSTRRARERLSLASAAVERLAVPSQESAFLGQAAAIELILGSVGARPNEALDRCVAIAQRGVEVGERFGLRFGTSYGRVLIAMARACAGEPSAVAQLKAAIELWRSLGLRAALSWYLTFLAEGQRLCDDHAGAEESIRAALEHNERTGEGYGASEAHRVFGALLADPCNPGADMARAAGEFERALAAAREQGAQLLRLRAAFTYVECIPGASRACTELTEALDWFQREGDPTLPFVREAHALAARAGAR